MYLLHAHNLGISPAFNCATLEYLSVPFVHTLCYASDDSYDRDYSILKHNIVDRLFMDPAKLIAG